ncbi:MAG: HAD family hydrolase [Propionibacteriales bacterium]|nr:HAD family hydrolase [Propionibacteriales bacterium]
MPIDAVIFDWGGTLTPWHTIDFTDESVALARAAVEAGGDAAQLLRGAGEVVWGRSRDEHRSATLAHIFDEAGLRFDEERLSAYRSFWDPHTMTDPEVHPLFESLRADGLRIGVLSNTVWPRAWHDEIFARDGVDHLIDGAVYTSEIKWTKPAPEAFRAAMDSVGVTDPATCVFVGDRLFDDIFGARNAGMKAIHLPHSEIPATQVGHTLGEPSAVVHRLAEIPDVIARWR